MTNDRLDPSLIFREQVWWSDVGKDIYNRPDKEKAKRLMREAGYKGEPIRWMATEFYDWMYKSALAAKQQVLARQADLQAASNDRILRTPSSES
jgi:peptide/nickel transport system substrate-binding protein